MKEIVVDSTWYIDKLRGRVDYERILREYLAAGALFSCGVIRTEVLRGISDPRQMARVEAFFDLIPEVPTDAKLWQDVARLTWTLDRQGKILPLTDLVIAACALRAGAAVVSTDNHFRKIEGLEVLKSV